MKDKIEKIFLCFIALLLLSFVPIYMISLSGYYDSLEKDRTTLTSEAMKRFEEDILQGKTIKAKDYLREKKDYNNFFSRIGIHTGNFLESLFDKGFELLLKEIEEAIQ